VRESGLDGSLSIAKGEVARVIVSRILMADLLVMSLSHPPGSALVDRFSSGIHTILRRSPRPVLVVPGTVSQMDHLLLAYDGSPKAKEALFLTAYMASRYHFPVTVVTVNEKRFGSSSLIEAASNYLQKYGIQVDGARQKGEVDQAILDVAYNHRCNLILMGGYGYSPVVEMFVGSTVDRLLRKTDIPVLICQ
jgi:nucleotide-binding universal stress UspA family protein